MSARAAVFSLLAADQVLEGTWNIGIDAVFPNGELDGAPRNGPFLILRWEEQRIAYSSVGYEILTVWAHQSRMISRDYVPLTKILSRVVTILIGATHVIGEDGVLTCATFQGTSPDFNDEVLKTISKNAAFRVVSRPHAVE